MAGIESRSGLYLEINALGVAMDKSFEETKGNRMYDCRNPPFNNKYSLFSYRDYW